MNCPVCGQHLKHKAYDGFYVKICPGCNGIWFDAGTMHPFLEMLINSSFVPNAPVVLSKPVRLEKLNDPPKKCPRCGCLMRKHNYSYDSNIIMDRCATCSGIWTDKHEAYQAAMYNKGNPKLDKLASSMASHVQDQENFKDLVENINELRNSGGGLLIGIQGILPIGDDIPKHRLPFIVLGLILLNTISLISALAFGDIESFCNEMGLIPTHIIAGQNLFTLYSNMFCHASVAHLVGNMAFLWIFGTHVEDAFHHVYFILFYLLCGIAANLAHLAMNLHSTIPCVGASGAIAGVMAAYLILYPSSHLKLIVGGIVMTLPAWVYLVGWFFMQLLASMLSSGTGGGIAWFAHIGGFVCGAIITFPFRNTLRVVNA